MSLKKMFDAIVDTPVYRAQDAVGGAPQERGGLDTRMAPSATETWCSSSHLMRCRHHATCECLKDTHTQTHNILCKPTWVAGRVHQLWLVLPLLHAMKIPVEDVRDALVSYQPSQTSLLFWCSLINKHMSIDATINTYLDELSIHELVRETTTPHLDADVASLLDPEWKEACVAYFAEAGNLQQASCMCPATGVLGVHPTTLAGLLLSHDCGQRCHCSAHLICPSSKSSTLFHARRLWGPDPQRPTPRYARFEGRPTPWYARFEEGSGYALLAWYLSNNNKHDQSLLLDIYNGLRCDNLELTNVTKILMALKIPTSLNNAVVNASNNNNNTGFPLQWLGHSGRHTNDHVYMDTYYDTARGHMISNTPPPPPFFFPWVIFRVLERIDCKYLLQLLRRATDHDYSCMVINLCKFFSNMYNRERIYCVESFFVTLLDACSCIDLAEARVLPRSVIYYCVATSCGERRFAWTVKSNPMQPTTLAFELAMSVFRIDYVNDSEKRSYSMWHTAIETFLKKMSPAAFLTCHGTDPLGTLFGQVCVQGKLDLVEMVYEAVEPLLNTSTHSLVHRNAAWTDVGDTPDQWYFASYVGIIAWFATPDVCCFIVDKAKKQWPNEMANMMETLLQNATKDNRVALQQCTKAKRANV